MVKEIFTKHKKRLAIVLAAIAACPYIVKIAHKYLPMVWSNLHVVNFIVAWIPAVLSILVAFVPDKEFSVKKRILWRTGVIACGLVYSMVLFHQQVLVDQVNAKTNGDLLGAAITAANSHADTQFSKVQTNVDGLGKKVEDVGSRLDQKTQSLNEALSKATGTITSNIGKAGKPDPPVPARLLLTLWDAAASADKPVLLQTVNPDSDGNYPVSLTAINPSEPTAENIDIWIMLCDKCTFAKEPIGFDNPQGSDEHVRHKIFASLNPGVNFEKQTILVNSKTTGGYFQIALRYSCKTCGGKPISNQIATIIQGDKQAK